MNLQNDTLIVTGAAGFIGGHVARILGDAGAGPVVAVDDLRDGRKYPNLARAPLTGYYDKDDFLGRLVGDTLPHKRIRAVFHLGANSDTTDWDGKGMMADNFSYSVALYDWCQRHGIPLIYASSAAVYGGSDQFSERPENEGPLNVYGYSKKLFDDYVRARTAEQRAQVVGLRYFNVYGPGETHKGRMASVMFHFQRQLAASGSLKLFGGYDGYGDGEQLRDFVHVEDVARVTTGFLDKPGVSGIFNVGTGKARSFNDVAQLLLDAMGGGKLEYVPFPDDLKAAYQSYTEADLTLLRDAGCDQPMRSIEEGVPAYVAWLQR